MDSFDLRVFERFFAQFKNGHPIKVFPVHKPSQ
jgi:hypothetical protein